MDQSLWSVVSVGIVKLQGPAVIAYSILISSRASAYQSGVRKGLDLIAVKCDISSQGHGQALGQAALFLNVA